MGQIKNIIKYNVRRKIIRYNSNIKKTYILCDAMKKCLDIQIENNNTFKIFFDENILITKEKTDFIQNGEIKTLYSEWCKENKINYENMTDTQYRNSLKSCGVIWKGIPSNNKRGYNFIKFVN